MKSYLITDPKYYTNNPKIAASILQKAINSHEVDYILFRDKQSKNLSEIAAELKKVANSNGIPILLSGNYDMARKLKYDGVHLTSNQFDKIDTCKDSFKYVGISTHSLKEAVMAQSKGVYFITYSPIFNTPNKGKPKGLADLNQILDKIDIRCFALGGIVTKSHIEQIATTKAYGFASIRYFIT